MIKFTQHEDARRNAMVQREIDNAALWMPSIQEYETIDSALEAVRSMERSREQSIVITYLEEAKLLLGEKLEGDVIAPRIQAIVNTYRQKADMWESLIK